MSVQFGQWNRDGRPIDLNCLHRCIETGNAYSALRESLHTRDSLAITFRPLHEPDNSSEETQPLADSTGSLLTWDGRLDNRTELLAQWNLSLDDARGDARLALIAYQLWGTACFGKLVGDWSLALWDAREQCLLLARDFIGVRHLYYLSEPGTVTWSTILDPLFRMARGTCELSEEFVAGYLSPALPAPHLTPYAGILAVRPGTFVRFKRTETTIEEFWRFNARERLVYRSDTAYEEHFRHVFSEAVRRRLRSSRPVLAELSGGIDSTSIVAVADRLSARGIALAPRVDTISYFDEAEPNWNERPYFSLVEQQRGRTGYHLDVGGTCGTFEDPEDAFFRPLPGHDRRSVVHNREFARCSEQSHSRVLLSGTGGDEFLGGVPTPTPELQDLFVRFRWRHLARQLAAWSLQKRQPWMHTGYAALEEFLPQRLRRARARATIAPWIARAFLDRYLDAFAAGMPRVKLTGELPSLQSNCLSLERLRRQLALRHLDPVVRQYTTYPYLDSALLDFVFAVPREQILRPGQRRSLMRRALAGLVPAEILGRRRKAFVSRQPMMALVSARTQVNVLLRSSLAAARGWIEPKALKAALESVERGDVTHVIPLFTTFYLELWLRKLVFPEQALEACTLGARETSDRSWRGKHRDSTNG
jgi:asparagine synthase (glutamine-hydrolysing)